MIRIPENARFDKVDRQAELDVQGAYSIRVPDGWMCKARFLDLSELIYVTEGSLHLAVNGQPLSLGAGDACLLRRYTTLSGDRASVGACSFYTVPFLCTLKKYDDLYGRVIPIASHAAYAESLLNNLNVFSAKKRQESHLLDATFLLLLEVLCDARKPEPRRMQIQGIVEYVNDRLSASPDLRELSRHFHYSADYISKMFKEQFGMSVKQYVIERKLSVAKRLLTTSDLSVQQVGQAVGFAEAALFEKFFRYHTKTTPRKYRALHL